MNARFDDNGNFNVPPTEHARLRAEKLARPVGTRVTRVECDTCHHIQDFTHPTGPDAHLALNATMGGQGWTKNGTTHTCPDCQTRYLVAQARALATPSRSKRGDASPLAERGRMIHRLADEIERLRTELAKLQDIRKTHRREYHDLHVSCEQRVMERNDARARLDRIREALAGHPRCDVHPDDDPISCGWMRAVASVQRALDTTEPTTEENPNA